MMLYFTMPTIQEIIEKTKAYLPSADAERLKRAYDFANEAHGSQKRFSGEPYIMHPLSVADILLDFHPSENMIIAALLHDVAEDTSRTLEDIEINFGAEVKELCSGLIKLSKVRSNLDFNDFQAENLRKLFLAMAKDYRIVLLKLCDRFHNMQTMDFVRPEKCIRISQETLNIYAPIAARLGIYHLKSSLEDLCFKYLHSVDHESINEQLLKTGKSRDKYLEFAKKNIMEILAQEGIQAEVEGRVKSAYSIYRKLKKKNKNSIDDIFDVFAIRIILPDIYKYGKEYTGHLYTALGTLHKNFTPLANRFKDYIAVPKVNGYRSLHTTLMGLGPATYRQPTEVQIRTFSMHQTAEFGIAAHWLYKEGKEVPANLNDLNIFNLSDVSEKHADDFLLQQQQSWLSGLKDIGSEEVNNQELMEGLRVDVFQDRIFVLTPRGDVKDLPAGATPVDFAYSVHTEIGNQCVGAKLNGNAVSLDYEIKNGDVIEIVTRRNARPSQNWLSFVKTNHARNRIRAWFHDLDGEKHLREGKTLLNEKLGQLGKPSLDVKLSVLAHYDGEKLPFKERQNLLIEIGKGVVFASSVIKRIFTLDELLMSRSRPVEYLQPSNDGSMGQLSSKLFIGGQKNMPHHFVKCCSADYKDELVGYVTRGRGVSVHRKNCKAVKNTEPSRLVAVAQEIKTSRYHVYIVVEVGDRVGLIRDITKIIADNSVNIIDFFQKYGEKPFDTLGFLLEIENFDQLDKVLFKIGSVPNVLRAFKVS